jgi:predicted Zn-dependent peptidase
MIRESVLPCGVRVLSEAMPTVRSATIGIYADVGSAAEPPERRGLSHLLEHMLFKGTARRSARAIAETMEGVGAALNAATDKELTVYYAQVIDRHLPLAIDVLADMFQHAALDPEELRKEREVVIEEIRMYDDSPEEVLHDVFARTLWRGANLGDPISGYVETVAGIDRDALAAWKRARYVPANVTIAAAGNLDHDDVVAHCTAAFAGFTGLGEAPKPEIPVFHPAVSVTVDDTEQAYVLLGMPGLSMRDERRYTLSVLDTIVGGGMSSRLFQCVREERGLAYEVGSFQLGYRAAGLFGVSAGVAPERAQECIDVIVDELERFADEGPTADEVLRAREALKGSMTLALESTSSRMSRLARNAIVHGRQISAEEVEERFDAVDGAMVHALARELFAPERRGLCVLGPLDPERVRLRGANAA